MIRNLLGIVILHASVSITQAAREIEVKISLTKEQYACVQAWLTTQADYQGCSEQTEYYMTHPADSWDYSAGFKDTLKTLRVRCEQKGDSFCYKYRHLDPVTKKTSHRDEYETSVEDGSTMVNILKLLGYTQQTIVAKKRTTYLVQDTFEVVLDDVQGVGSFIEIELKDGSSEVKCGIARIEQLMKEMGIVEFKQYDRGYIHMLWNPGYDFGTTRKLY